MVRSDLENLTVDQHLVLLFSNHTLTEMPASSRLRTANRLYKDRKLEQMGQMSLINTLESVRFTLSEASSLLLEAALPDDGLQDVPPAFLLRLGNYRECYQFLRWYAAAATNPDHPSHNEAESYLQEPADLLEPVDVFLSPLHTEAPGVYQTVAHLVFLIILKIRLLFDLQKDNEVATILRTKLPQELVNRVLEYVPDKLAPYMDVRAMKFTSRSEMTHVLKAHILTLYQHVDSQNRHFWGALFSPAGHLSAEPADYMPGSVSEMQVALRRTYREWVLTPGAISYIRGIKESLEE